MFNLRKKQKKAIQDVVLVEGMIWKKAIEPQMEKREQTLLLKGILVYLIVMGVMGGILSSLGVSVYWLVLHFVVFAAAVFCAMLYKSTRWQNAGYVLLLFFMAFTGNGLKTYINSGFYSVMNELSQEAANFFNTNAVKSYGEQIGNRELAITVAFCYVGCVACILTNILISRYMQYLFLLPACIVVLFLPVYYRLEPSLPFDMMFFTGCIASCMLRGNGHFALSQDDKIYHFKKKKISYRYGSRAFLGVLLAVGFFVTVIVSTLSFVQSQEKFLNTHTASSMKKSTMDVMKNYSLMGFMGLFNFYPNTGGLTSGKLGGVNSIRLDFESDLLLEFMPYKTQRMYFKTFTGATYQPVNNVWERASSEKEKKVQMDLTTKYLKKRYQKQKKYSAMGKIKVINKAAPIGVYLPYYSEDTDRIVEPGKSQEYTFYPDMAQVNLKLPKNNEAQWLTIPEENKQVIASFCEEVGLSELRDGKQVADALLQYYQDNIPYSYRPGATPRGKDFVNYFLQENRRGYCAHFASAATLVFRYLGIPARYIEGYALDPEDISERAKILSDLDQRQYFDGYAPLKQSAVVSVDATDANAHAWVEIYDTEKGWHVVDVTPAAPGDEEADQSFWSRLMHFLGGNDQEDIGGAEGETGDDQGAVADKTTGVVAFHATWIFFAIFLSCILLPLLVRKGRDIYYYLRGNRNDKLIFQYKRYRRKHRTNKFFHVGRRKKRTTATEDEEAVTENNYREQLSALTQRGILQAGEQQLEQMIQVLEKAGFSQYEISEEEWKMAKKWFH